MTTRVAARKQPDDTIDKTYILVTGTNAGLGLATCIRLIDEFIYTRPSSQHIHLIITTRSSSKSLQTISILENHIQSNANLKASSDRISLSSHEVDLTQLRTVLSLAATLNNTYPYINSIICNAGIMGLERINFYQGVKDFLRAPIQATTWPQYNVHSSGTVTERQIDVCQGTEKSDTDVEPPLGNIFAANVFGHYLLIAHIMPLLSAVPSQAGTGRIIWTGSVETYASAFQLSDIQCLTRCEGYSSSKRLTDILALTSESPSTRIATKSFFAGAKSTANRPKMYLAHPGVAGTDIVPLLLIVRWLKILAFYIARLFGSPWHTISTYKGAVSAVWLALTPATGLDAMEEREGKGKWGSATDLLGDERVSRTEVEGWGFGGQADDWRRNGQKGRRFGAKNTTAEDREEFEKLGKQTWEKMEALRKDWEERLA